MGNSADPTYQPTAMLPTAFSMMPESIRISYTSDAGFTAVGNG